LNVLSKPVLIKYHRMASAAKFGAWCMAEPGDGVRSVGNELAEYAPAARPEHSTLLVDIQNLDVESVGLARAYNATDTCASTDDSCQSRSLGNLGVLLNSAPPMKQRAPVQQPKLDFGALDTETCFTDFGDARIPAIAFRSDSLELILAPGDLFVIPPSAESSGRCLLSLTLPCCIRKNSEKALSMNLAWPTCTASGSGTIEEVWRIHVLESSRGQQGFRETDALFYLDRSTGLLTLLGEADDLRDKRTAAHEAVHVWQSPLEFREKMRVDLMMEALADMQNEEVDLSAVTMTCFLLRPTQLPAGVDRSMGLAEIKACWGRAGPTCAFAIISFWHRYLCKLAASLPMSVDPLELIMRWLPLRADRATLGDFLSTLQSVGWTSLAQIPQLFPAASFNMPLGEVCIIDLECIRRRPHATRYGQKLPADMIVSSQGLVSF
jgi:hypothetical protein